MKDYIEVNRENARRIISKADKARYKRLEDKRYLPIIDLILKHVNKEAPLLDIGIREGKFLEVLKKSGFKSIYGVDVYIEGVERAKSLGFEAKVADAQNFSLEKKFDAATLSHVLEHCPEPNKVIQNVYDNVLNDDGILYVEVPVQKKEPVPTAHAHFYCFTSMTELLSFFDKSKWSVVEKLVVGEILKIIIKKLKGE